MIGCYEGLKVTHSAESVGRQTTRAVVEAVFLVIVRVLHQSMNPELHLIPKVLSNDS